MIIYSSVEYLSDNLPMINDNGSFYEVIHLKSGMQTQLAMANTLQIQCSAKCRDSNDSL